MRQHTELGIRPLARVHVSGSSTSAMLLWLVEWRIPGGFKLGMLLWHDTRLVPPV